MHKNGLFNFTIRLTLLRFALHRKFLVANEYSNSIETLQVPSRSEYFPVWFSLYEAIIYIKYEKSFNCLSMLRGTTVHSIPRSRWF